MGKYAQIIDEAKRHFGQWDARTIGFYCYFALHFVQIMDWKMAHIHLSHICEASKVRKVENFEQNVINDLMMDYFSAIIKLSDHAKDAFLNEFGQWLGANIMMLHEQQLLFANQINAHFATEIEQRKQAQTTVGDVDDTAYDYADEMPKCNVLTIIASHVRIFMFLGKMEEAHSVITDVIDNEKKTEINPRSHLLSAYLSVQTNAISDIENVSALSILFDQITTQYPIKNVS